jgi:uncharacterized RDD family membrane protein YckC
VIKTCKQCGAINQSSVETCCFCSARLNPSAAPEGSSVSEGPTVPKFTLSESAKTRGSLALQPEWRREVRHRLQSYRERRGQTGANDSQTALEFEADTEERATALDLAHEPKSFAAGAGAGLMERGAQPQIQYDSQFAHEFDEATDAAVALDDDQYEDPLQATLAAAAARIAQGAAAPPVAAKKREPFQHLLIDVSRPPEVEAEGSASQDDAEPARSSPRLDSKLFPVADLSVRRHAATVDAICLVLAYAVILGSFAFFGGKIFASKLNAIVGGAIFALLYTQYFTLFTMMGGATPGMMLAGLRLVSFDGSAPEPRQLMRRSAGYLLSGGMALMGFLWSFWDEDHLSWHDHISQTYITPIEENSYSESAPRETHS